jgi:acyl-homoserine lactone synthase
MIVVVNAENRSVFEADLIQMYRQRKAIFVDHARWKVPVVGDQEIDCYDREDTIYLLAKERLDSPLLASVRLLSTMKPHLMGDLFTAACRDAPPCGSAVWEVSRFCTTTDLPGRRIRLDLLWEVICGVMETALLYGIDQVIFAANRALLPLALTCGWEAGRLGETLRDEDDEVTAATAVISTAGLRRVRHLHGVSIPAIRLYSNAPSYCYDLIEARPAINGQQRSPLTLGQAAPAHQQHIRSTEDLAHG